MASFRKDCPAPLPTPDFLCSLYGVRDKQCSVIIQALFRQPHFQSQVCLFVVPLTYLQYTTAGHYTSTMATGDKPVLGYWDLRGVRELCNCNAVDNVSNSDFLNRRAISCASRSACCWRTPGPTMRSGRSAGRMAPIGSPSNPHSGSTSQTCLTSSTVRDGVFI